MTIPPTPHLIATSLLARTERLGVLVLGPREMQARPTGPRQMLGYLLLLFAGTALAYIRIPPSGLQTLWAEDASIFATGAYAHPWWQVVLEPYAGYAAAYPRTLAALSVSFVNISQLPDALAILACATTASVGVIAVWALRYHIRPLPLRLGIWAIVVAMPIAGVEVNGSIANSHWYLMIAAFLVLVTRQRSWPGVVVGAVVVITSILSDPLTILAAPLALLRLTDRGRRGWVIPSCFALAAVVQVAVDAGTHVVATPSQPALLEIIRATIYRTMLQPLLGSAGAQYAHGLAGSWAIVVGGFCVVGLLGLGLRTPASGFALVAAAGSLVMFAVEGIVRWTPSLDPANHLYGGASRYNVVPIALMSIAIVAILSHCLSSFPPRASFVLIAFGLVTVVANLASIGLDWNVTARSPAVRWQTEITRAAELCAQHSNSVRIAGDPPGFDLFLSCTNFEKANQR